MIAIILEKEACCAEKKRVCDYKNNVGYSIVVEIFDFVVNVFSVEIHYLAGCAVDDKDKFERIKI